MVPKTFSCPVSWKPASRDWQYLYHGNHPCPTFCMPSHLPATNSFAWHLTKSSLELSVLVYCDAAPLFPSYLLISALFPLQQPSAPLPYLSPPSSSPLPSPATSCTAACPLHPWEPARTEAGEGDHTCARPLHHSCWPWSGRCPSLGVSPPADVPHRRAQPFHAVCPSVPPRLSHSERAHT